MSYQNQQQRSEHRTAGWMEHQKDYLCGGNIELYGGEVKINWIAYKNQPKPGKKVPNFSGPVFIEPDQEEKLLRILMQKYPHLAGGGQPVQRNYGGQQNYQQPPNGGGSLEDSLDF